MQNKKKFPMYKWCEDLFPICRSITGPGIKKTLNYFEKINPDFKRIKFKSRSQVFDWKIPDEWHIDDAYIQHESGIKFAEFKKNNLHLVNYSMSVDKILTLNQLKKKIYTNKNLKNAIPYVTSYYKKSWGFCMKYSEYTKLPKGNYKVYVSSKFKKGNLDLSHALIKGETKKEIFFSSYVCHPSMANNELSGPVVLNALLSYIKKNFKKTKFSYRFVLLPETIGSIAYLSKYKKMLQNNVFAGYVLSCLGDDGNFSIVNGPNETCKSSRFLKKILEKYDFKNYNFLERGSDERQYCSPNINLPVTLFCRSKFDRYKEYHSSLDNLNLISQKNLQGSLDILIKLIHFFENSTFPKNKAICEPRLSKRGLYPTISKFDSKNVLPKKLQLRTNFLAYANGEMTSLEIANKINQKFEDVKKEEKILINKKIVEI